jgi:MFS family permease
LSFAITLSIQIIPVILISPFAGVLADRLNKKSMIIFTDLFSGMVFVIMYLISQNGLTVSMIYLVTFFVSISETLFNICIDTSIPNIVSGQNILKLNSVSKIIDSISSVISPSVGGILFAVVDIRIFILINGISFIFSAFSECFIDFRLYAKTVKSTIKIDFKKDIIEGFSFIKNTGWIVNLLVTFILLNFFIGFLYAVPIPFILNNVLYLSGKTYGILQSIPPIGMIIGALLIKKVMERLTDKKIMYLAGVVFSVCIFFLGIFPAIFKNPSSVFVIIYYGIFLLILGILISLIDIPFINNMQNNVPEDIRGRVLSISISLIKIVTPISYILSGVLINRIPSFTIPLFGSFLSLFTFFLLSRIKPRKIYL